MINRAVYRSNDEGYLDPKRHAHIWLLEVPTASDELPKPVQLTSGNFDESQLRLEPRWLAHLLPHAAHRRALLRTPKHGYLLGACGGWEQRKTHHRSDGYRRSRSQPRWPPVGLPRLRRSAGSLLFAARSLGHGCGARRESAKSDRRLRFRHGQLGCRRQCGTARRAADARSTGRPMVARCSISWRSKDARPSCASTHKPAR